MKFRITRTSDYDYEVKPCEGVEKRTVKSFSEYAGKEIEYTEWVKEFNTLEDLMDFIKVQGQIVIEEIGENGLSTIDIYDDYRE